MSDYIYQLSLGPRRSCLLEMAARIRRGVASWLFLHWDCDLFGVASTPSVHTHTKRHTLERGTPDGVHMPRDCCTYASRTL